MAVAQPMQKLLQKLLLAQRRQLMQLLEIRIPLEAIWKLQRLRQAAGSMPSLTLRDNGLCVLGDELRGAGSFEL